MATDRMKIAQIAPLYESVPPQLYGGTERVVSYLTEALVKQGHDVTLFASEDSQTLAHFDPIKMPSLRLSRSGVSDIAAHYIFLERVMRRASDFDVLHFHVDFLHYPFTRRSYPHHLATLHGRMDLPGLTELYREYWDQPVVSISMSQRLRLPEALWIGTVYHGVPKNLYAPSFGAGQYLAFLGRMSPEKGPATAIAIAERVGMPIKLAAKVDAADEDYFDVIIKPLFDNPLVEFVGEVDEAEKNKLLSGAAALIFPIRWPEPFGLVMIEAFASGTPVVGFDCGSVKEVIDVGLTGVIAADEDEAVALLPQALSLDRRGIRATFEKRFTADHMANDYSAIYRSVAMHELSNQTGALRLARERVGQ